MSRNPSIPWKKSLKDALLLQNSIIRKYEGTVASSNFTDQQNWIPANESTEQYTRLKPVNPDRVVLQLDLDASKLGRIARKDVENAVNVIKSAGSVNSMQGLFLIRCCGELMPTVKPAEKTKLAQYIFETLPKLGCKFDVSHYNALLKVYLENEHVFQPTEFLAEMEAHVSPNRVTYQRLIGGFCQIGDIEGASKILEFMKDKGMSVNEYVFNLLITGHVKADDMDGAREMLVVMRNAKLEPSRDTFTSLACGYASKRNIEAIEDIIKEAKEAEVPLGDKEILKLIVVLAINGETEKAEMFLDKLQKGVGFNQECVNCILQLVTQGHHDLGYKLLKGMPRGQMPDGTASPAGRFFVKHLVNTNTDVDIVVDYCKKMRDGCLNEGALLYATQIALYEKNEGSKYALKLIEEMHKQDMPIRPHYFWPIIANSNTTGVFEVLEAMKLLDCLPNHETLQDYVFPKLVSSYQQPDLLINKLKDFTLNVSSVVIPLVSFYISNKELSKATETLSLHPVRLNPRLVINMLVQSLYHNPESINEVVQILCHLRDNPEVTTDHVLRKDTCGQFLLEAFNIFQYQLKDLVPLMTAMAKKELYISHSAVDIIKLKYNIDNEMNNLLENLSSVDFEAPLLDDTSPLLHPREMTTEDLENHLAELRSKGMNVRGVLRRLLMAHCKEKNLQRVLEVQNELEEAGFDFSNAMHSQLVLFFTSAGQVDEALKHLKLIASHFVVDTFKVINLATLLIKEGRTEEALELITGHEGYRQNGEMNLRNNIQSLLNAAADKGDENLVKELSQLMEKYVKPDEISQYPLIRAYMNKDDLDAALTEFERIVKEFRVTPGKNELFKKFLIADNASAMQKILDLSTSVHGEVNTLYDLALCFIEMQQPKQAKKVLETPGLRAQMGRLETICQRLLNSGHISELEQFVSLTKSLFGIDRDRMYQFLLQGYDNDGEKALEVWSTMQEEDVQPSAQTLNLIAQILIKQGLPVPFEVPAGSQLVSRRLETPHINRTVSRTRDIITSKTSIISKLLIEKNIEEAKSVLVEMLDSGLHPTFMILRSCLSEISRTGDTLFMANIKNKLDAEVRKRVFFNTFSSIALVSSGGVEDFLDQLDKDEYSESEYPTGAVIHLLKEHPHLEDRVFKLAQSKLKNQGHIKGINCVWSFYMLNSNYSKAQQLIQDNPELKGKIFFRSVLSEARRNLNMEMAEQLVKMASADGFTPLDRGIARSAILEVHLANKRPDLALNALNEALKEVGLEDLRRMTLIALRKSLLASGQNVPFQIPRQNAFPEDEN